MDWCISAVQQLAIHPISLYAFLTMNSWKKHQLQLSVIPMVTYPRPHWRQQSLHGWFGWFRRTWAPSTVSVYYPNPQIDPVRNAVSSSERTSLLQLPTHPESPAHWQAHRESLCTMCVWAQAYRHTQQGAGGERAARNSQCLFFFRQPVSCCGLFSNRALWLYWTMSMEDLPLLCFSLSVLIASLYLPLPVPFSLPLPLPHCLQLHLFPSMWQMIAGLFFFLALLVVLSLCLYSLSSPSVSSQPLSFP